MIWIDIVIGMLLILDIVRGFRKGLVKEAGTIIGIVAGFLIASAGGNTMARFLAPVCKGSEAWSGVVGFLLTFLVVLLLIIILSKIFEGFLNVLAMGWLNRLAGGFFCLLRGVLVMSIVLNLYQSVDKRCRLVGVERAKASLFYKPVRNFAPALFPSVKVFQHAEDPLTETSGKKEV